jgi:hypothetical protein
VSMISMLCPTYRDIFSPHVVAKRSSQCNQVLVSEARHALRMNQACMVGKPYSWIRDNVKPSLPIAAAVVVPTMCAVSRHFRGPGKVRRIWATASCGVPCKSTEIPGGVCCASRRESRKFATLPPPTRCTTVSGVISSGLPIGTLDLVMLGEWPLCYPSYYVSTKKSVY